MTGFVISVVAMVLALGALTLAIIERRRLIHSNSGEAVIDAVARALHDKDIREQAVDVSYPECADYYLERAGLAVSAYLKANRL